MGGVTAETATGLVAGEAVIGAGLALGCLGVTILPRLAALIAEVIGPQKVSTNT